MAGMKPPGLGENTAKQLAEHAWQNFRDESGGVYSAHARVGRSEEAAGRPEALRLDDTPETRIALVKAALSARRPAPQSSRCSTRQGHEDEGRCSPRGAQQMGPGELKRRAAGNASCGRASRVHDRSSPTVRD